MKALALSILLMLAPIGNDTAYAQAVAVQSGEHEGFTRLVLELGQPSDWVLGRTADGYELHIDRKDIRFDVSKVFQLIPRHRLAAIWVDPANGNLQLGVGCACYALPFEFRPGIIVIDLHEGSPPPNSSFETALDGSAEPQIVAKEESRPQPRPTESAAIYDWRAVSDAASAGAPKPELPLAVDRPDLKFLRDSLLRQMSDGAARGVIEMTGPPKQDDQAEPKGSQVGTMTQVRIGEDIGFEVGNERHIAQTLTADGANCLKDDQLDIEAWGEDLPVVEQMATALTGLTGEFDHPAPEAVSRAIRFYLFLGFGKEAQQVSRALDVTLEDRAIWETMAQILDNGSAPEGPFSSMQGCDTAAALWAVLARPEISGGTTPNKPAVLRSFSALPLHLRRHLGPILSDRFIAANDLETARSIRDAILRAPGEPGPEVRLMGAELDLAQGDNASAEGALKTLTTETGPAATEALISYVETLISQGKPVEPGMVSSIAALAFENRGTELGVSLQTTYVLALAAAGDFDAAFAQIDVAPKASDGLWKVLAETGPDSALLVHAVLPAGILVDEPPLTSRRKLAERLLGLGFADPALLWLHDLTDATADATDGDRLLLAKAQIRRRDGQAALRVLAGLGTPEAATLRAEAQIMLGDPTAAAKVFAALGGSESELSAARAARDWPLISTKAEGPWQAAASLVVPGSEQSNADADQPVAPPGSLARGRQAVDESIAARATLLELLAKATADSPLLAANN
ncbi:MAG: hypothetical protein WCC57_10430 [Paracoccaceae bacterium]